MKTIIKRAMMCAVSIVTFFALVVWFVFRPISLDGSIPQGWGYSSVPKIVGSEASRLASINFTPTSHPQLAQTNSATMHVDAHASDVHPRGGPLGQSPEVRSYAHGAFGGECANVTFNSKGNLVAMCATFTNFYLVLMSRDTLRPIDSLTFPPRTSNKSLSLRQIMSDTSGGAYFFLNDRDEAVFVDSKQILNFVSTRSEDDRDVLQVVKSIDLKPYLELVDGEYDPVTSVLPGWSGNLWFVTRHGTVGYADPENEEVITFELDGEEIQNSFVVDEQGAFIISDYALYAFEYEEESKRITEMWRYPYERASSAKPGSITLGSGTTPTLIGERFIAFANNASSQIEIVVLDGRKSKSPRLICTEKVFRPGESATENTLIGIGNSVIVENNFGYDLFTTMMFGRTGVGGLTRVDFDPKSGSCQTVWENPIISQTTVPKLSAETGLIYVYSKYPDARFGADAYYLSALDFHSGETVYSVLTGTGVSYDNNWAPIFLAEDRCAYVGVLRGLVEICDRDGRSEH